MTLASHSIARVSALVFISFCLSVSEGKPTDTGFKLTMDEGNGRVVNAFADGNSGIVAITVYHTGELVDCHAVGGQEGKDAIAFYFYESAAGRTGSRAVTLSVDIERLARKCRKFLRAQKKMAAGELSDAARATRALREGFEGTNWCGHYPRNSNSTGLGEMEAEDKCCKKFRQCKRSINGMMIQYFLWNYNSFPMTHCECQRSFEQCLAGVNSDLSAFISQAYDSALIPCFSTANETSRCVLWDDWYNKCDEMATDLMGSVTNLGTFQLENRSVGRDEESGENPSKSEGESGNEGSKKKIVKEKRPVDKNEL